MTVWVPRSAWTDVDARGGNNPHNGPKAWAVKPATTVIVHYVGSSGSLKMPSSPAATMRSIQDYGWQRDGAGIEYGAMVFHDGSVWGGFEGEVGAHCSTTDPATGRAWNYSSWGLCAYLGVGNDTVPDEMMDGLVFGIRHAQERGWVAAGPLDVIGHSDTGFATSCPGPALYPRLGELAAAITTPPQPSEDDDMNALIRQRFRGWHNQWLVGAGTPMHLTPETAGHYAALGVPEIVCEPHPQTVRQLLELSHLTTADLVPTSDGA